jgi:hypothetical protein
MRTAHTGMSSWMVGSPPRLAMPVGTYGGYRQVRHRLSQARHRKQLIYGNLGPDRFNKVSLYLPHFITQLGNCRTTYSLRVADHVSCMIRNMLVRWMSSC